MSSLSEFRQIKPEDRSGGTGLPTMVTVVVAVGVGTAVIAKLGEVFKEAVIGKKEVAEQAVQMSHLEILGNVAVGSVSVFIGALTLCFVSGMIRRIKDPNTEDNIVPLASGDEGSDPVQIQNSSKIEEPGPYAAPE